MDPATPDILASETDATSRTVAPSGPLTAESAVALLDAVVLLLSRADHVRTVVVSLEHVTSVDEDGVRALHLVVAATARINTTVVLTGARGVVARRCRHAGLLPSSAGARATAAR